MRFESDIATMKLTAGIKLLMLNLYQRLMVTLCVERIPIARAAPDTKRHTTQMA
jgi:hypothetical protein